MEAKVKYQAVGLFVVLIGLAALFISLWLGQGIRRAPQDRYYAFLKESVSGLSLNAPVRYRGVDVGRVRQIGLDPRNSEEVRLMLEIVRGTPIKRDTYAILRMQGLTGYLFLELAGGTRGSPLLEKEPGKDYRVIRTAPSFLVRLDTVANTLTADAHGLARDAREVLDARNRENLRRILADLSRLSQTLATHDEAVDRSLARLPEVLERMDGTVRDIGSASRSLEALLRENRQPIDRFAQESLPQVGPLVAELRQLTAELTRLARQVEREPSSLLTGRTPVPPGPGE